jgi:hypothetical protein
MVLGLRALLLIVGPKGEGCSQCRANGGDKVDISDMQQIMRAVDLV